MIWLSFNISFEYVKRKRHASWCSGDQLGSAICCFCCGIALFLRHRFYFCWTRKHGFCGFVFVSYKDLAICLSLTIFSFFHLLLQLQDTETTTGESEVKFQVSRDTLGAMLRSMAYIREQLSIVVSIIPLLISFICHLVCLKKFDVMIRTLSLNSSHNESSTTSLEIYFNFSMYHFIMSIVVSFPEILFLFSDYRIISHFAEWTTRRAFIKEA